MSVQLSDPCSFVTEGKWVHHPEAKNTKMKIVCAPVLNAPAAEGARVHTRLGCHDQPSGSAFLKKSPKR